MVLQIMAMFKMKCRVLPNYCKKVKCESEFSDMDFLLLSLLQSLFPVVLSMSKNIGLNLEHLQYAIFQS